MKIPKNFRLDQEVIDDIKFIQNSFYEKNKISLNDTETVSYAIRQIAQQIKNKEKEIQ